MKVTVPSPFTVISPTFEEELLTAVLNVVSPPPVILSVPLFVKVEPDANVTEPSDESVVKVPFTVMPEPLLNLIVPVSGDCFTPKVNPLSALIVNEVPLSKVIVSATILFSVALPFTISKVPAVCL